MSDAFEITWPERAAPLRGKVPVQQLDLLIRRLKWLPASPVVVADVLGLASGAGDLQSLAAAAGCDPAISAYLLSLACGKRPSRPPQSIVEAVETLSPDGVRSAVLGMKVFEPANAGGFHYDEFLTHCVAVACSAELLAERATAGGVTPPAAYMCGLLHDIGKVALQESLPGTYRRILSGLQRAQSNSGIGEQGNIARLEREIIGPDHTVAGRRLAQHWSLPTCVTEAIWLHHQPVAAVPEAIESPGLLALVQLADMIARRNRLGFSGNYTFTHDGESLAAELGLSSDDVARVEAEIVGRIEDRMVAAAAGPPRRHAGESMYRSALADAGAKLSKLNESLAKRADVLARYAVGLNCLGEFTMRLSPTSSLPRVCEELVRIFSDVLSIEPSRAEPVCTFAVCDDVRVVLAVCTSLAAGQTEDGQTEFRFSPSRRECLSPTPGISPAGEIAGLLLLNPNDWSSLIDLNSYICLPMLAGGRLAGGVLLPKRAVTVADDELLPILARITAFILAAVCGRGKADRLAEQLAGASQRLEQIRDALARSHALAAVGEMAAGAAHEMNNPLAVISGRAQLLAGRLKTKKDRESADLIALKAQEISDIITDLMASARPSPPCPEALDVADLLERAKNRFESEGQQKLPPPAVDITIEPGCPPVLADAGQLEEVLAELLRNAATAADGRVNVNIRAGKATASSRVLIRLADDGPGMDESVLASAFTPFFSHRRAGRGRGMGLTRARCSVQNNGGRMWIESKPGEGTIVFIELAAAGKDELPSA